MPKRPSTATDPNLFAKGVFDKLLAKYDPGSVADSSPIPRSAFGEDSDKNPAAVALGKLGGRKGGLARARNLSPAKQRQIAKKAAKARWSKKS